VTGWRWAWAEPPSDRVQAYQFIGYRDQAELLRVKADFRDLDAPSPLQSLGFDGKALLEAGFFTDPPAMLLA
jgi:hypothetical protein